MTFSGQLPEPVKLGESETFEALPWDEIEKRLVENTLDDRDTSDGRWWHHEVAVVYDPTTGWFVVYMTTVYRNENVATSNGFVARTGFTN